ncbi:SDR family NAD(P)-dependent oxidoreductase [Pseudaquabacterium rugosum]|uniref:SDR family NAD(P)-dependent oxidoreductase n=1 Tax=Pseudaquabacterium rugosum TaxID=2984194 RepID=A0ABU9B7M8_9BURK
MAEVSSASHLTLITGASRGLGLALARARLGPGQRLLTLARQPHAPLADEAAAAGARLVQWAVDLADPQPVAERLAAWLQDEAPRAASFTLINNAALLGTPGPVEDQAADELARVLRVGLEAPLLLSRAFIAATEGCARPRRLVQISSGLGRRAMAGSAAYCAIKAGLDHFSRCVALEQDGRPWPCRVVSIAPGVVETSMQQALRGADPRRFAAQAGFASLHAEGRLSTPEDAARALWARIERADFGQDVVADVRS